MKRIVYSMPIGLIILFFSLGSAQAQFVDPVDWNYSWKEVGEKTYVLTFKAEVDEGWHIYSQFTDPSGPIPTSFNFEELGGVKLEGKVEESGPMHRGVDEIFGVEVAYFEGDGTFKQKVTFAGESTTISGYLEYMVCDDSRCLPPATEDFSFTLEATAKPETKAPIEAKTPENEKVDPQPKGQPDLAAIASDKEEQDKTDPQELEKPEETIASTDSTNHSSESGQVVAQGQKGATGIEGSTHLILDEVDLNKPVAACTTTAQSRGDSNLLTIFLLGLLGGFVALLTPCVFPMIPLTVSFFTKSADKGGVGKAFLYGFSIFLIYVLISVPFHLSETISASIFNEISTNVWLNLVFFVIFVVFAISFFGYFELTLPSGFTNKVSSASSVGGLIGIFLMAVVLALVSFSCTGPILGTLLVGAISSNGGAMQLTAGLAGFGLALGLPFGLLAASPKLMAKIPRSGGWMVTTKVILGFIELALAFKFLSNADLVQHFGLLKREIFFAIWIMIGVAMILYLLGFIRFAHDEPVNISKIKPGRWGLIVAIAAFVAYLVPGLTNTPAANRQLLSGFPPPLFYSIYEKENECPLGIECFKDYEEGMAYAQAQGKPVMIDFTGWACVNCRKMEENVWVKRDIFDHLNQDYVLISLYVDDRKKLPNEQQIEVQTASGQTRKLRTIGNKWAAFQENFGANSQPYYVLMSPDEKLLNQPVGYTPDVTEFKAFLECGLDAYQQLTQR